MVLAGHSDASPLSIKIVKLRRRPLLHTRYFGRPLPDNQAALTIAQIIDAVMSTAAEVELGALYSNCPNVIPTHRAFIVMGHHETATPIKTNNKPIP